MFKYEDKARVISTGDEVEVIDVLPSFSPWGVTLKYRVFSITKGHAVVSENNLERIK